MNVTFKGKAPNPARAKLKEKMDDYGVKRFNPASGITETMWRVAIQEHNHCPESVEVDLEGELIGFSGDFAIIAAQGGLHKAPLGGVKLIAPAKAIIPPKSDLQKSGDLAPLLKG